MSLKPQPIPDIPEDTARIARAAFRKGNTWVSLRDELGSIYKDEDFASLFSTRGQPAQATWQLALVTIMQFAEGLSDTQAASSVCGRIDWKYALSLELTDPGFDASVLCEFRARLIEGQAEKHMLEAIYAVDAPEWLSRLPAVETLRRVWVQQYYLIGSRTRWRTAEEHGMVPAGVGIHSPHDTDARYSDKRSTTWVGYKAHLTETCDEDKPRLITEVETTEASVPDHEVVDEIHQKLSAKQ